MKKTLTLSLVFLLLSTRLLAQVPAWAWAKAAPSTGTGMATGMAITTDAAGNIYATGYYQSTTITFGSTTLTNQSTATDMYLVKYDASGNVVWAKSAGGTDRETPTDIAVDATGNIYITGYFSSAAFTLGTTTLVGSGVSTNTDIFVAKFDAAGTATWATSVGGTSSDASVSISVDASGSMFVSGYFSSPAISFGSSTLNLTTGGTGADMFIAKYMANGTVSWAKSVGGTLNERIQSMDIDGSGSIYITGYFHSTSLTFASNTITNSSTTNKADFFIAKYSTTGSVVWAKSAGGAGTEQATGVTVDATGNVYICGTYADTFSFAGNQLTGTKTMSATPSQDIFLAKFNASGTPQWAKGAGGSDLDACTAIAKDGANNVYISCNFTSTSFPIGDSTFQNTGGAGSTDIVVAKYAPNGNNTWVKASTGGDMDLAFGIATDASNNIFITGRTMSNPLRFGLTSVTGTGSGTTYLAKIGPQALNTGKVIARSFSFYPNPNHGQFTIEMPATNKLTLIRITDVAGRQILSQSVPIGSDPIVHLKLNEFTSGIYVLDIDQGEEVFRSKFIVE